LSDPALRTDVLIVGGGLAGSVLAAALTQLPLRVALVESRDPRVLGQPSFDARATALAYGSQRILAALGLWNRLAPDAEPIESIHIGERGRFGTARLSARDERVAALGYTIENRIIGRVVWDALADAERFHSLAPAELTAFAMREDELVAEVVEAGKRRAVSAQLMVAADGAHSIVRGLLGIAAREFAYRQCAVTLNCRTEEPHRGRAFERFTAFGPLAVLPLTGNRVSVVWTCAEQDAANLAALDEAAFRSRLQSAFGFRLGHFTQTGARSVHTLKRVLSDELGAERTLLFGNAAVSVHPVAGQGFNLALRDVAALTEVLAGQLHRGGPVDAGAPEVLERYRAARRADQQRVATITHGLIRLFGRQAPGLGVLRGLGLAAFDRVPVLKTAFARQMMGLAGQLPGLARGLPVHRGSGADEV
jgi:2-octaprenyl-6-methoxyphenol hydroxylase